MAKIFGSAARAPFSKRRMANATSMFAMKIIRKEKTKALGILAIVTFFLCLVFFRSASGFFIVVFSISFLGDILNS